MAQDHGSMTLTFIDNNSEASSVRVPTVPYDDATYATVQTDLDTLKTAIDAVTDGVLVREARAHLNSITGASPPNDDTIQRERKFLVMGHDDVTFKTVRLEIPCAASGITTKPSTPGANEYLDLTAGAGLALKNALETVWRAGDTFANTVTVDRIELVHRRS